MDKAADKEDRKMSLLMDAVIAVSIGLFAGGTLWLWLGTGESLALIATITGLATCL
ncbi:MAG: hypothetical protein AAFN43_00195 [Pseudomonadota bacterium]